ncbi:MAG: transposase [Bacteroidota bacterium]
MTKYQNKYRIESIRLPNYDYSQPSAYFITICTHNKIHYFGEITNGKMQLNEFGKIVEECWNKIPEHFMHVSLDYFVIMPNHFHGILIINNEETQHAVSLQKTNKNKSQCRDIACYVSTKSVDDEKPVETQHAASLQKINQFGCLVSGSLPVIIRSFKSACTKQINTLRPATIPPIWQRNYYEHIIRNEKSLSEIRNYIQNNPLNWEQDEYYIY